MKKRTYEVRLGKTISVINPATVRFQESNPLELMIAPATKYQLAVTSGSILPATVVVELELDNINPPPDTVKEDRLINMDSHD